MPLPAFTNTQHCLSIKFQNRPRADPALPYTWCLDKSFNTSSPFSQPWRVTPALPLQSYLGPNKKSVWEKPKALTRQGLPRQTCCDRRWWRPSPAAHGGQGGVSDGKTPPSRLLKRGLQPVGPRPWGLFPRFRRNDACSSRSGETALSIPHRHVHVNLAP